MGGSASLTQLYQLPEIIDFQTFMTITKFKFTPESYDIFADRDGQISRQRMIEVVASRDCYLSYEWGFDSKSRSVPNRVQLIVDYLTTQGLYVYTEDGQYRNNMQMGDMTLKDRVKQSLITSQCMILCLTERYYQKLVDTTPTTPAKSTKENQIQIEFNEFIALKGVRYIIPIFLEEKGKLTEENAPSEVYNLLSSKFCLDMTEFEYNPQQLEDLYGLITKTIKPLREGGNFIRSDLDFKVSNEGKHFHWLSERFNIEEYNISLNENESFKKDLANKRNSMSNVLSSSEMNTLMQKNSSKQKQATNNNETEKLLSNMKHVSKMNISRDLLKKYAKIFAEHHFETITRILPLLQANDDFLLEIGIEKIHSEYLRQQILIDVKENFDSSYTTRIDAILNQKKSFHSKEDNERQRVIQQQIEASNRMKELSLMAFEDHLSYCYEEYCDMILKQELFHQKRQLLIQQIDEENQKHTFLMISCQQSYERRKYDELQEYRRERFERIVQGSNKNIAEVLANFRETLQKISEITLSMDNSRETLNPLETSLLGRGGASAGMGGDARRSSSIFPYGPASPLSPKKGMTVDTSFLVPKKSPKNIRSRSLAQLNNSTISTVYSPSASSYQATPQSSSMKLVPYGMTQPQAVQPDINATRDPEELSYLLQETVYIFKRMELYVLNSMDHVTFLLENSIIKLLTTFLSQQYIHYITFTSTHFLTDSHFFQLSLPHQPLLLLAHCVRCRVDYNAMHSSLIYLLHRYGILSLLFELMKWYIEKVDVLALCLYVIDLIITTKEHSVLLSYLAPYLSSPATQAEEMRGRSGKHTPSPQKKASTLAKSLLTMNPNEFYLLFLMILLEKYYYHADGKNGDDDDHHDSMVEEVEEVRQEIIYRTPSKRNSRDHSDDKGLPIMRPLSVRLSPRTPASTSYLISSPSSGRKSPRSSRGSPRPLGRTSPSSPKALTAHFDKQVHLLYEKDYKEMLLMICAIFSQLASLEKYDTLLMKCREKLVTTLINEIITIPITNIQFPDEYFYNFLFSLESLYYTKCIVFLPQNPVDSHYRLAEKYGLYDCTISYALKPDSYSMNTNLHASLQVAAEHQYYRKLSEKMILQLHEFVLIKYLINTFHYYCYHHEYQSIEMMIQIIRVIGNVIYCRNDLKKICYEYLLHKELIYLLRVGLQMLKYQVTASTAASAATPGGQGFNSREVLKDVHMIIQEEDRERKKEMNPSFHNKKTPTFKARMRQQFSEAKSVDLDDMSQATSTSPSASYSPSVVPRTPTASKGLAPSAAQSIHQYQPSSSAPTTPMNHSINKSLKIDTNPPSMKSNPYPTSDGSPASGANNAKYINQTRLLGVQLLIETMQTFNNLLLIDTTPSLIMKPKSTTSEAKGSQPEIDATNTTSNEAKTTLQLLQDSYTDIIEKYNLGEILMEIFIYLSFDSQLIYAYLLFLHKLTQKGNYVTINRLVALGFVERFLQLLEAMFYQSYEDSVTFDHYLLICQLLMNLCQVDVIRVNAIKRIMKKKDFVFTFIMASMKRFCISKEYEFAWRYTHFYSNYILLTQDKLYHTTTPTDNTTTSLDEADDRAESKTSRSARGEKESEKGKEEDEEEEDEFEGEGLDHNHYKHRICVSCMMNCKLLYCLFTHEEYQKDLKEAFITMGIQQFLSSSFIPKVKGEISDLIPVLYSERSNHSTAIPHPGKQLQLLSAEAKSGELEAKKKEEKGGGKGKDEGTTGKNKADKRVFLIPVMDLSSQLLSEASKPSTTNQNTGGMGDSTLRRSQSYDMNSPSVKEKGKSDKGDVTAPAATNETAAFDSSKLLQQLNHSFYLNRNIEFLENIEEREFTYYMSFIFHQFNIKY